MEDVFEDVYRWLKTYGETRGLKVTEVSWQESPFMGDIRISIVLRDPNNKYEIATQVGQPKE